MISTTEMVERERANLDEMAKSMGGADFARHIAQRTRMYLLQELARDFRAMGYNKAAQYVTALKLEEMSR